MCSEHAYNFFYKTECRAKDLAERLKSLLDKREVKSLILDTKTKNKKQKGNPEFIQYATFFVLVLCIRFFMCKYLFFEISEEN